MQMEVDNELSEEMSLIKARLGKEVEALKSVSRTKISSFSFNNVNTQGDRIY
jgi:hypothetical protein